MGFIGLFYPWGVILQAVAILHFVRRRPDNYWLWIILIGGGLGALVYIVAEVDAGCEPAARLAYDAVGRRRRIRDLETAILDNPSVGNIEELADQYWTTAVSRARGSCTTVSSRRAERTRSIRTTAAGSPRWSSRISRPPSPIWNPW